MSVEENHIGQALGEILRFKHRDTVILCYKIIRFSCLKLKILEMTFPNDLYFLEVLYRYIGLVLGYFPNTGHFTLEARGESTSIRMKQYVDHLGFMCVVILVLH